MTSASEAASGVLARAACRLQWATLPQPVRQRARALFVDTVAAMAAGLADPGFAPFAQANMGEAGLCTVIGCARVVPAATAVLLNGGATTVLQAQDGHRVARGHPASSVLPVVLALAEVQAGSSEAVMTAFIAGYEVSARIGIALGGMHPMLHDAGTWGAIGGAVAGALLLHGPDPVIAANAIEAASAVALFPDSRLPLAGVGAHHLYMGLGANAALAAARGAGAGLEGSPGTLERFFLPRAGAAPDASLLTQGIAAAGEFDRFEMLGGYLKWHPVCAHWSTLADAMAALVQAHGPLHERADRIEVGAYAAAIHYNVDDPENALAARFSARAIAAAMLDSGHLALDAFSDAALASAQMRERMSRIHVAHDPVCDAGYPAGRPVRLSVHLRGGGVLAMTRSTPRGDAGDPLSLEDVEIKARMLLARAFADPNAVLAAVDAFLEGGPMADLSAALRGA